MTKDRPKRAASSRNITKRYYNPAVNQKALSNEDIAEKINVFEQNENIKQHLDFDGREQWENLRDKNCPSQWGMFSHKLADFSFYPKCLGSAKDVKRYGEPNVHYALGYNGLAEMARIYGGDLRFYRPPPLPIPGGVRVRVRVLGLAAPNVTAGAIIGTVNEVEMGGVSDENQDVASFALDYNDDIVDAAKAEEATSDEDEVQIIFPVAANNQIKMTQDIVMIPETPQRPQSLVRPITATAVRSVDAAQGTPDGSTTGSAARVSISPVGNVENMKLADRVRRAERDMFGGQYVPPEGTYEARLRKLEWSCDVEPSANSYKLQRIAAIEAMLM